MIIKIIDEKTYENYVTNHPYKNMYQTINWLKVKQQEKREIEILGFYQNNQLVGASYAIKIPILKKFYHIYFSRGILTNYDDNIFILELTNLLKAYYQNKKVIKITIDPAIILSSRDVNGNITKYDNDSIKNNLEAAGFIFYGYNLRFESLQMRFIHRLKLTNSYEEQTKCFDKSTKKNIELAIQKGVRIRKGTIDDLELGISMFNQTATRKNISNYSLNFYKRIFTTYKEDATLYIAYIDKNIYLNNMQQLLKEKEKELEIIINKKSTSNVGKKLLQQEEIAKKQIIKYQKEIEKASSLQKETIIASLFSMYANDEYISFASGMDNNYRDFCPKYAMYPAHIKDAIEHNMTYVNFLGVTGIFDKNDKDYGIYDVKRGFGGETIEYIGQFTLPLNKILYNVCNILKK